MRTRAESDAGLVLVCDELGTVTGVRRVGLGLDESAAVGRRLSDLVHPTNAGKAERFLDALRESRAAFDWELALPSPDGHVATAHFAGGAVDGGFVVIGAGSRSGISALVDDFVEIQNEQATQLRAALKDAALVARAQAERDSAHYDELSRLNNELATAQRELAKKNAELERLNAQKNQFLGIAAHDLRNPLEVILTYSQFLREDARDALDDEQAGFVETIHRSSRFMLKLVNDLLDVAKIEAGRLDLDLAPTDLAALVERNLAPNRALAERRGVEIAFDCERDVPPVLVDPEKIDQVLNNLVGNAVKFSPSPGVVRVRLARRAGRAVLSVRDDGPGIPASEVDRLFKPFERVGPRPPSREKGAGLGLAIVKRIVAGHGGEVWVESEVGRGTELFVALPVGSAGDGPRTAQ